jgi:hypothetical protein
MDFILQVGHMSILRSFLRNLEDRFDFKQHRHFEPLHRIVSLPFAVALFRARLGIAALFFDRIFLETTGPNFVHAYRLLLKLSFCVAII